MRLKEYITLPPSEFGFSEIEVTPNQLTVNYIAADDGSIIDSFSITDNNVSKSGTTAPKQTLLLDNAPNDSNPANNVLKLNQTPGEFQFQLQDIGNTGEVLTMTAVVVLTMAVLCFKKFNR